MNGVWRMRWRWRAVMRSRWGIADMDGWVPVRANRREGRDHVVHDYLYSHIVHDFVAT